MAMDETQTADRVLARRMLIVEDDEGLRELIERALRKWGYEVVGVSNGAEAIERITADPAQVLLLDQRLPDMSGREIVTALAGRGLPAPFVMMTGHGDERLAVDMMKLGAADYLLKDTDLIDRLPGVMDRVFRSIETERNLRAAEGALRRSEERLAEISTCLSSLGPDYEANVERLTALCGHLLGATCALYNRIEGGMLCSAGQWRTPPGFNPKDSPEGHICHDVIARGGEETLVVRNLPETPYADSDPNVRLYGLRSYVGHPVRCGEEGAGAICAVFQTDFEPTADDRRVLLLIATALSREEERKRRQRDLEQALARNTALLKANPDLMFLFDGGCRILDYYTQNPARDLYRPPEEFLGKACDAILPPDVARMTREKVMEVLATGKPTFSTYALRLGEVRHYECRYVPCGEGQVLAFIRDITDRKLAEAEKESLQGQLTQAQKMETVGRLAGGVAHDFNNMLGVILGFTELSLDSIPAGHPLRDGLMEIRKAAERSADLTRQLLAFARKQTITPKVLDLNETVEGMLKMLRRLIGEHIDLSWRPGREVGPLRMDPSQIDQILVNLCVNACDAIGGPGAIAIETAGVVIDEAFCARHAGGAPGPHVRLSVSDSGCGMDAETLAHIFEPFFTTKKMGEGTGLGLATVYGIVRQNNGFIDVDSEPGRGTTFTIHLPRHEGKSRAEGASDAGGKPPETGHATILLVEDEPALLNMTRVMLERLGHTVLATSSPGEAMRIAERHPDGIHLLMTDVVMPEMNGRDLARNLLAVYPGIKRLFMSGYTAEVIAHQGVVDEGIRFLKKPFSMKDLADKLVEVMEGDGK